jgi:hypothetical protein
MTEPRKRLSDDEVIAIIDDEVRQSLGFDGDKLSEMRRKAMYYYLGEATEDLAPPSVPGRSQVVATDVRNTIEAMLPQLMVTFTGGDSVVECEATEEDDEAKATQVTQYLNYLFFKKNKGRSKVYTWLKDGLMAKRGFMKVWWDTTDQETREEYKAQDSVCLSMLMDDDEIKITEQESYPDEEDAEQRVKALEQLTGQLQQAQMAAQQGNAQALQASIQIQAQIDRINQTPPAMLYDVVCKRTKKGGRLCIENIPPEQFLISATGNMETATMVGHRFRKTASQLKAMGFKESIIDQCGGDDSEAEFNMERIEREEYENYQAANGMTDSMDDSQKILWGVEAYIWLDRDGDGIAELHKITKVGKYLLDDEITDVRPFCSWCPVPIPHLFYGMSIADLAMPSQLSNTMVERAVRDNVYLEVNGRYAAVEGQVNLDDLLSSRPGGVVRMKAPGMVSRLDQGKGNIGEAMNLLEFGQQKLENSTGWSRQSQGNDPDALYSSETATKTRIVANKADMRTELVAVQAAEGFEDLFKLMLKCICQNQRKADRVKLEGEWVDIDPREWTNQFDMTINVGLGMGDKDQRVQRVQTLQNAQAQGLAIGISTPENLFNSSLELAKNLGFKSTTKFFTKPDPNKPMPNPGAAEAQAKMQLEQGKIQAQGQIKQMELEHQSQMKQLELQQEAQLEQMRAQMQAEVDNNRQRSEAEQQTLKISQEGQLAQMQAQFDDYKHQREDAFLRWKAELEAATKIEAANIGSKAKIDNAATQTATAEISREVQP